MTKHRPSPNKPEGREHQFEKLLAAMEANDPFSRYGLEPVLEQIKARWAAAVVKKPGPKLVGQYRKAITKVLALSNKIGPDFFAYDIEKAGWSRQNPEADDISLHELVDQHGHLRTNVDAVLTELRLNIDHWLGTNREVYKKRDVRKLVVEPFLQLMVGRETKTSRKDLFEALFDWIGIAERDRPSSANVNAIAREQDAPDSSSERNAKRQTKN